MWRISEVLCLEHLGLIKFQFYTRHNTFKFGRLLNFTGKQKFSLFFV